MSNFKEKIMKNIEFKAVPLNILSQPSLIVTLFIFPKSIQLGLIHYPHR